MSKLKMFGFSVVFDTLRDKYVSGDRKDEGMGKEFR